MAWRGINTMSLPVILVRWEARSSSSLAKGELVAWGLLTAVLTYRRSKKTVTVKTDILQIPRSVSFVLMSPVSKFCREKLITGNPLVCERRRISGCRFSLLEREAPTGNMSAQASNPPLHSCTVPSFRSQPTYSERQSRMWHFTHTDQNAGLCWR